MAARKNLILFLYLAIVSKALCDLQCNYNMPNVPKSWIVMAPECEAAMTSLISTKLLMSAQYLALGSYFSRDSVNRLGFAKMFYSYADTNRDQAIELIDYIVLRGEFTNPNNIVKIFYVPSKTEWTSAEDAVTSVLNFEANITNQFHNTVTICEKGNIIDYNIANWLSNYFLDIQYNEEKYFADFISSLQKMRDLHQNLGEFFSDLQL